MKRGRPVQPAQSRPDAEQPRAGRRAWSSATRVAGTVRLFAIILTIALLTAGGRAAADEAQRPPADAASSASLDHAANQLADEVFASDDFWWKRTKQVEAPSFWGNLFGAIYDYVLKPLLKALSELFQKILEWILGLLGMTGEGDWSSGIPWLRVLIAILAGIAVWRVIVMLRRPRTVVPQTAEEPVIDRLARADQLLQQAQTAFDEGHLRDAVRLAFLALISHLQDRGRLSYDPSRSNREYQRDLRPWPEIAAGFRTCAEPFERCWYGGRCPESTEVGTMISLCRKQLSLGAGEG